MGPNRVDRDRWDRRGLRPYRSGAHNFVAEDVIVHNSIEQDADLVAFIYRDEIYNPTDENKGLAELIVAKHRNGETGTIELVFLGDTTSFRNLDRHGGPPAAPF